MHVRAPLLIETAHDREGCCIRVHGELDLIGSDELDAALAEVERQRVDRIVIDLEQLAFIDSRGLQSILGASRRARAAGTKLLVLPGTGYVAEMFRLTGLDLSPPLGQPRN